LSWKLLSDDNGCVTIVTSEKCIHMLETFGAMIWSRAYTAGVSMNTLEYTISQVLVSILCDH
jgi:hypothetical protein